MCLSYFNDDYVILQCVVIVTWVKCTTGYVAKLLQAACFGQVVLSSNDAEDAHIVVSVTIHSFNSVYLEEGILFYYEISAG